MAPNETIPEDNSETSPVARRSRLSWDTKKLIAACMASAALGAGALMLGQTVLKKPPVWKLDDRSRKIGVNEGYLLGVRDCPPTKDKEALCGTRRPLTAEERTLLTSFFGPSLDTSKILIHYISSTYKAGLVHTSEPGVINIGVGNHSKAALQNINGSVPALLATLAHEVTHLLQNSSGLAYSNRAKQNDSEKYSYTIKLGDTFKSFTNEQGGAIVSDFVQRSLWGDIAQDCAKKPDAEQCIREGLERDVPLLLLVSKEFKGAAGFANGVYWPSVAREAKKRNIAVNFTL